MMLKQTKLMDNPFLIFFILNVKMWTILSEQVIRFIAAVYILMMHMKKKALRECTTVGFVCPVSLVFQTGYDCCASMCVA